MKTQGEKQELAVISENESVFAVEQYTTNQISASDYVDLLNVKTVDLTSDYWSFESVLKNNEWKEGIVAKTQKSLQSLGQGTDEWAEKLEFLRKFKRILRFIKIQKGAKLDEKQQVIFDKITGEAEMVDRVHFFDTYINRQVIMGQAALVGKVKQTIIELESYGLKPEGQALVIEFVGKKPKTKGVGDYHDVTVTLAKVN